MRPFLVAISFCLAFPSIGDAQLFTRLRNLGNVPCPNGVCPTSQSSGHWSYPGSIDSHLTTSHGVSSAGMSHEQRLSLHDSLHTGRSSAVVTQYRIPSVVVSQTVAQAMPVDMSAVIVATSAANDRRKFIRALMQAARQAKSKGEITSFELATLSVLSRTPGAMEKIQAVVHETAVSEGLATTTAIDWDALIAFIEKLIPLIIQLIGLFG